MTHDQVRTYGGWRRSRGIGILGLGLTATLVLLGGFVVLVLLAAFSLKAALYVAPPIVLTAAAGMIRVGGVPIAQLAVQRVRWRYGVSAGHTGYRADIVLHHAGVLQLPGTLAATELLSAEDGYGSRYGLVRDRHSGYLTATVRVVPTSTWLADTGDADGWVANWGAWLASLGYIPALRWVTVTVDTAPDPGSTLTDQVARAVDPSAPRAALEIMDQLVASAPAAAADVDTRVSITFDPARSPAASKTVADAVTETGQTLVGLESALGSCGVTVLGRARAADIAGVVRTAFDPAVRGNVNRLLASGVSPALEEQLNWASAGPAGARERWDCYQHDSGVSVSYAWREAPRQNVHSDVLARLVAPGPYPKRVSLQYRPLPGLGRGPRAGQRGPGGGVPPRVLPAHPPRCHRPRRPRPCPRPPGRRRGGPRRRGQPAGAVRDGHRHRSRPAPARHRRHRGCGRVVEDPAAAPVPEPGRRVHRHPALRHLPARTRPPHPALTPGHR